MATKLTVGSDEKSVEKAKSYAGKKGSEEKVLPSSWQRLLWSCPLEDIDLERDNVYISRQKKDETP